MKRYTLLIETDGLLHDDVVTDEFMRGMPEGTKVTGPTMICHSAYIVGESSFLCLRPARHANPHEAEMVGGHGKLSWPVT